MKRCLAGVAVAIVLRLATAQPVFSPLLAQDRRPGITAVEGIRVGHHTLTERPTGCTVILVEKGATGGVAIRGSAPGRRETDLLDPSEATGLPSYPSVRDLTRK